MDRRVSGDAEDGLRGQPPWRGRVPLLLIAAPRQSDGAILHVVRVDRAEADSIARHKVHPRLRDEVLEGVGDEELGGQVIYLPQVTRAVG